MSVILRPYGVAATIGSFPLVSLGIQDYNLTPTLAAGDVKISKDNAALANLATLPTVSPAGSGLVLVSASLAELQCAELVIRFIDQTDPKDWKDQFIRVETYGHPSAMHPTFPVDVTEWDGTAVATPDSAGHPKVTVKDGTAQGEILTTTGKIDNVILTDTATVSTDMRGTDSANTQTPLTAVEVKAEVAAALETYNGPTHAEMTAEHGTLATPAQVGTEVATALATYDGPTRTEMTAEHTALSTEHGTLATPAQVGTEVATALETYNGPTHAEMTAEHGTLDTGSSDCG